jgi:GNAT superfamily N-acetyltransferase
MAPPGPTIRRARAQEAAALSALTLRSKAHWGYSAEQMAVFRDELTFTPAAVVERRTHVLEEDGAVVAMYTLLGSGAEVELEHLFVDPPRLRQGHGKRLFEHACDLARAAGAQALVIKSDPHAAGFYRTLGAADAGEIPSSIPGRNIPTFRLLLRP